MSFDVSRGEIIGVAGVEGNGQSELMRALAGLQPSDGAVRLNGRSLKQHELLREAAFMPSDRHAEGLAGGLTVRENAALAALEKFAAHRYSQPQERAGQRHGTPSSRWPSRRRRIEAPVLSLSGGNQQKVVMARALLSEPRLIVADEPTQGVDVGARAEIYRILREVSNSGTPVVVNSSDAAELEGLCDQVIVMSRGRVVETLSGQDVVEARIVAAAVSAVTHRDAGESALADRGRSRRGGLRHLRPDRQRAGGSSCDRHGSAGAFRLRSELELSVVLQHRQHPASGDRPRLHRARADHRDPVGRDRPVGRSAGGLPGRGRLVFRE